MIYIIIKAQIPDIMPLIEIINSFTLNRRQRKIDYMKVSMEGSVEYILEEISKHIPSRSEDQVRFEFKTDPVRIKEQLD
jgi:hypothetical protein